MAIQILKEVNRTPGYAVATGATVLAGQPLMLTDADTVQPYDGSVDNILGLALDTNAVIAAASDIPTIKQQSGLVREMSDRPSGDFAVSGLMYDGSRGSGLISAATDGGIFEVWDDGRGSPWKAADSGSFVVNNPVYANEDGLLTVSSSDGGNPVVNYPVVGICVKTPASDGVLGIQLRMASAA